MTDEILRVQLAELKTIRFKRKDGSVFEASDMDGAKRLAIELRDELPNTAFDEVQRFLNALERLSSPAFPVQIEFALNGSRRDRS